MRGNDQPIIVSAFAKEIFLTALSHPTSLPAKHVGVGWANPLALLLKYPELCRSFLQRKVPANPACPGPWLVKVKLDTPDGLRFVVSPCVLTVITPCAYLSSHWPLYNVGWLEMCLPIFLSRPPACFLRCLLIFALGLVRLCVLLSFPPVFFLFFFQWRLAGSCGRDSAGNAPGRHLGSARGGGSSALRLFSAWQGRTPRQITGWLRGSWQSFKTGLVPGVLLDSQTDQFTFTFRHYL